MKKELSPSLEMEACDVCGRTILKGERTAPYLVPDGTRRFVCDLCTRRAEGAGWLRESSHGELPAAVPRTEPRRSLLSRFRRRFGDESHPEYSDRSFEDQYRAPTGSGEGDRYEPEAQETPPERSWSEPPAGPVEGHDPARGGAQHSAAPEEAWPGEARAEDAAAAADADGYAAEEAFAEEHVPEQHAGEAPLPSEPFPAPEESLLEEEPTASFGEPAGGEGAGEHLAAGQPVPFAEVEPPPDSRAERRERRSRRRLRDPRHVRAVPSGADAKVERALELFNESEHRRTVGGLARTLGYPLVAAIPTDDSTSDVIVVVAWELSWYQFRVDLTETHEAVTMTDKGHEIDEIEPDLRRWNATTTDDGALEVGGPAA